MIKEIPRKHPYLVIALAVVALLLVFGAINTYRTASLTEKTEEELCKAEGGVWRQMPNTCVDSCEAQREGLMCAQALTYGCDCGEGMCWNGKTCEEL